MFLVCGEALYDLFIEEETPAGLRIDARIGGSPFNVAVGLARLGRTAALLTGVSNDALGDRLAAALEAEGVETRFLARMINPTTLAVVALGPEGEPRYTFYGEGAADRSLTAREPSRVAGSRLVPALRVVLPRRRSDREHPPRPRRARARAALHLPRPEPARQRRAGRREVAARHRTLRPRRRPREAERGGPRPSRPDRGPPTASRERGSTGVRGSSSSPGARRGRPCGPGPPASTIPAARWRWRTRWARATRSRPPCSAGWTRPAGFRRDRGRPPCRNRRRNASSPSPARRRRGAARAGAPTFRAGRSCRTDSGGGDPA